MNQKNRSLVKNDKIDQEIKYQNSLIIYKIFKINQRKPDHGLTIDEETGQMKPFMFPGR